MGNGSEDAFGRRVREERLLRGWTQADLAERLQKEGLKLHPSAIAKIEDREAPKPRTIRLDEASAIARVFGRLVDEMYEDPDRRIVMGLARVRSWLDRLVDIQDEGVEIYGEVNGIVTSAESPEQAEHLSQLFRIDYLRKLLEMEKVGSLYHSVMHHPSRLYYGAKARTKEDRDDDEA